MTGDSAAAERTDPPVVTPRDAATLVMVDRSSGEPRVLMGRRRLDQVFMPGKYVFPGGRVDATDRHVETSDNLPETEVAKLLIEMKDEPSADRARAVALAAIRETFEEAGIVIGRSLAAPRGCAVAGWQQFFSLGYEPRLGALRFFARAITPPGPPRRYDTRFFFVNASEIAHRIESNDGELSGLHWLTIAEANALEVSKITKMMLDEMMDWLSAGGERNPASPVPFYYQKAGTFHRQLLQLP